MLAGVHKLFSSIVVGAGLALALAASALAEPSPLELASPAGPNAHAIDDVYWVVFAVALALFALVLVGLAAALLRGRRAAARAASASPAASAEPAPLAGVRLLALAALPVAALVVVAVVVFAKQSDARKAPAAGAAGSIAVKAVGTSSGWTYTYANGATSQDLRVPTGATVRLTITSGDVQHSWWVPELAGQVRVFPGETARLAFRADRDGTFGGRSTVAQGAAATPEIAVTALPQQQFENWLGTAAAGKGGS